MHKYRVMVVGGYGFFGSRLVRRLALQPALHVVVAGRSGAAGQALVDALSAQSAASLSAVALDAMQPGLDAALRRLEIDLLVHTSGPFQGQDHRVARACIAAGVHYADLADGRDFVCGIQGLDAQAQSARVLLASGASSVPALSTAAADALAVGMSSVDAIDIGISPGNRTERGLSTVAAILGYCGKRLEVAGPAAVFGWLGAWRHAYPAPVGWRLLSPCDVPDLALLAPRYAGSPNVRFGAGLELEFLHRGMNAMAWLVRLGLVRDWSAHAVRLKRMADWFKAWGTDAGAMHVHVRGRDAQGAALERGWALVAGSGDGPYVPTLAASALARQLAAGRLTATGAMPCMGLLTLEDFRQEAQGLDIRMLEVGA